MGVVGGFGWWRKNSSLVVDSFSFLDDLALLSHQHLYLISATSPPLLRFVVKKGKQCSREETKVIIQLL